MDILVVLFLVVDFSMAAYPQAIGYVQVKGPDGDILFLRVVQPGDPNASDSTLRIALPGGVVGAAYLVDTTDVMASPVRVMTPHGIRSWRAA